MNIVEIIKEQTPIAIKDLYGVDINIKALSVSDTRKEFEGDYTIVTFPFTKPTKKNPQDLGDELGKYFVENVEQITAYNVIKGFLNLTVSDSYWKAFLQEVNQTENFGKHKPTGKKALVEFSSPNTNKPLHLGHIRNILLGWSTSKILEYAGQEVVKTQIINDRGIAVCKSMLAWQKFGEGVTPESSGIKGDHFVGDWYVEFDKRLKKEYSDWQSSEEAKALLTAKEVKEENVEAFFKKYKNEYFNTYSSLGKEAKEMLLKWEAGDAEVKGLWQKMNQWVYDGFEVTYENLGVNFDKLYYESDTYLLGKDLITEGLEKGVFYQKEDGSTWIDLEDKKLDHKLVLRSDGTSVYTTQDIGTANIRYKNHDTENMIYVVADEQNHHFKALFAILEKLGEPYAAGCHHLSYGMVNLPSGRMKSREGTVVDADDLMAEVIKEASNAAKEIGALADLPEKEQNEIFEQIGLAALKFFIIKVNPKKSMIFDPSESVDMQGQTGPYIQNAGVRIKSIIRKVGEVNGDLNAYTEIHGVEKELLKMIHSYPSIIQESAKDYDPSHLANFCYALAKGFHKFYNFDNGALSVIRAENDAAKKFRKELAAATLSTLTSGMNLLGIDIPERM